MFGTARRSIQDPSTDARDDKGGNAAYSAPLLCHPERSGELHVSRGVERVLRGAYRKTNAFAVFGTARRSIQDPSTDARDDKDDFCLQRSFDAPFIGLPKSIEELFGKRSGRRCGQGGKRSAPSAMAPWRDELRMTECGLSPRSAPNDRGASRMRRALSHCPMPLFRRLRRHTEGEGKSATQHFLYPSKTLKYTCRRLPLTPRR